MRLHGGGVPGFLWYNDYSARYSWGIVGSLSLGGVYRDMAVDCQQRDLLLFIGAFSWPWQSRSYLVAYSSYCERRIFHWPGSHHHFELKACRTHGVDYSVLDSGPGAGVVFTFQPSSSPSVNGALCQAGNDNCNGEKLTAYKSSSNRGASCLRVADGFHSSTWCECERAGNPACFLATGVAWAAMGIDYGCGLMQA